MGLP
jgi:hypothetical protein